MTTAHPADQKSRIVFLDWLRIFAFLSVLAGHQYSAFYANAMNDPALQPTLRFFLQQLWPCIEFGGAGVVVFFLVSGYIITQVLMRESPGVFLVRRFFRIYPLYICAVLLEAANRYRSGAPFVGVGVLLQQMSLFGDLFQTPHALAGVEWTLRVEVLFYLFMAALKWGGVIDGRASRAMPAVLAVAVAGLFLMPCVPGRWAWCYAYLNLYGPFLLLGSYLFLYQNARAGIGSCLSMGALVMLGYWILLPQLQPPTSQSHFAAYGVLIFLLLWWSRSRLSIGAVGLALSELTYAVYLFHNWLYPSLATQAGRWMQAPWAIHITALAVLLGVCWLAVRGIERPAIHWGHRVAQRWFSAVPGTAPQESSATVPVASGAKT